MGVSDCEVVEEEHAMEWLGEELNLHLLGQRGLLSPCGQERTRTTIYPVMRSASPT